LVSEAGSRLSSLYDVGREAIEADAEREQKRKKEEKILADGQNRKQPMLSEEAQGKTAM
jgi:hypothetical protein